MGKIAIVTGGTTGLGLAIASELARNGATVIVTSRKNSKLKKACDLIDKNFYGFQLDLSNKNSIIKFIKNTDRFDQSESFMSLRRNSHQHPSLFSSQSR